MAREIEFTLNGNKTVVTIEDYCTLLHLLREELGFLGTKEGCGSGECGACTVIVDGDAINSCLYLAAEVDGREEQETFPIVSIIFHAHYILWLIKIVNRKLAKRKYKKDFCHFG